MADQVAVTQGVSSVSEGTPELDGNSFAPRARGPLVWGAAALLSAGALATAVFPRASSGPADEPGTSALVQDSGPHAELAGLSAPKHVEISPEEKIRDRALSASPTPGWHWAIKPQEIDQSALAEVKFVRLAFVNAESPDQEAAAIKAHQPVWKKTETGLLVSAVRETDAMYQLVAFDTHGDRVDINVRTQDPHSLGFYTSRSPDVKWIGFQAGNPEELGKIAKAAYEEGKKAGVNLLTTGTVGKPFEFALTDINGKVVTNKDFAGKTVIMLEWATWCMNCHALMKQVFPTLPSYGDSVQLILIGHDRADARPRAMEEIAGFPKGAINVTHFTMTGKDGKVPENLGELWAKARTGVDSYGIPTVVVVGPDGTLLLDQTAPSLHSVKTALDKGVAQPKTADASQSASADGGR